MTDQDPGPAGRPSPFGVPQQPFEGKSFNQQGYSPPPPAPYNAGPTGALPVEDKSPLIALICGILAWLGLWVLTAIPAVIFGVKGRRAAREGRTANGGMATAGLWLGIANLVIGTLLVIAIVLAIAIPVFLNQRMKGVDASLKGDLNAMAALQDEYVTNNPGKMGFEVAATSPGGVATAPEGAFTTHPGNVIAVEVGPEGYCVSGYNLGARHATSPTRSMVYLSGTDGIETAVGAC